MSLSERAERFLAHCPRRETLRERYAIIAAFDRRGRPWHAAAIDFQVMYGGLVLGASGRRLDLFRQGSEGGASVFEPLHAYELDGEDLIEILDDPDGGLGATVMDAKSVIYLIVPSYQPKDRSQLKRLAPSLEAWLESLAGKRR